MKRFGSQLHKKAQGIRLSSTERADLRARIVSYLEYHPLPKETKLVSVQPQPVAEPYRVVRINYTYLSSFVGVFTMLLLVVVPVVAEQAVPGDALYPVKIQFNEEIRSTLAFSPYAKVEWETKRLERRLAEARLLADEGRLTEEIEAEVVLAVQNHSNAAKQEIAEIRATDTDEATIAEITFASALEVQSEVLESRASQVEAGLAGVLAEARSGVEGSQDTTNISYEKLLARLEMETTHAQELFTSIQDSASEQDIANIERRFEDIKRKIDDSAELYEAVKAAVNSDVNTTESKELIEKETEAKNLLKIALTDSRKLVSFMTDIDVRTNVSIEELVPVTLTAEETEIFLLQRLEALNTQSKTIEMVEPFGAVVDKFEFGKAKFAETLEAGAEALEAGNYKKTETLIIEAEAIAADLIKMGVVIETGSASSTEEVPLDPERSTSSATSSITGGELD